VVVVNVADEVVSVFVVVVVVVGVVSAGAGVAVALHFVVLLVWLN